MKKVEEEAHECQAGREKDRMRKQMGRRDTKNRERENDAEESDEKNKNT